MYLFTDECYSGNGKNYKGMADRTKSKKVCQNWLYNKEFPSSHYPDLIGKLSHFIIWRRVREWYNAMQ